MTVSAIPQGAKIRVVGDVHGDATGFAYAIATDRFIIQLGDLIDHGPDSAATLRMMFDLVEAGRGLFVLGNHDLKLARVLSGEHVRVEPVVQATVEAVGRCPEGADVASGRRRRQRGCGMVRQCSFMAASTPRCWNIRRPITASTARTDRWRGRCTASRPAGLRRTDTRSAACVGSTGFPTA